MTVSTKENVDIEKVFAWELTAMVPLFKNDEHGAVGPR